MGRNHRDNTHTADEKRPSSVDVARAAGVSRATVSAYINGTRYVSPELSERIEEAIRSLNYVPDPMARALKMKDTKTIGLVIPVISRFFTPLMQAVNEEAQVRGYGFLVSSSEEDPERERTALEVFVAKRASGILVVPASLENGELIRSIRDGGTPVVQVNRRIPGLSVDSVTSNNFNAAYRATMHLFGRGCRRVAFLGYDPETLSGEEKRAGYEKALADTGSKENLIVNVRDHDERGIRESLGAFLDCHGAIDGLIGSTQGKTAIALAVLKQRGIRIPEDIAVVGFDDTPWSPILDPPLTVVTENTFSMGQQAVQLLLDRIEGKRKGSTRNIVLEDELIVRSSA
ncbi:MAG: LacI family DNA-binding transcriptional regulator [Spirochaetes bacterium]|nr:LacI family DNA-binding transcriptional regulator [Spirochaetota bacterium]